MRMKTLSLLASILFNIDVDMIAFKNKYNRSLSGTFIFQKGLKKKLDGGERVVFPKEPSPRTVAGRPGQARSPARLSGKMFADTTATSDRQGAWDRRTVKATSRRRRTV